MIKNPESSKALTRNITPNIGSIESPNRMNNALSKSKNKSSFLSNSR